MVSFNELKYFTSVTSLSSTAFMGCSKLISVDFSNLISGASQMCRNTKIVYAWFPKIKTVGSTASQGYTAWFYGNSQLIAIRVDEATSLNMISQNAKYMVCTMSNVPPINDVSYIPSKIYVPDSLVQSYQSGTGYSGKTVLPLSQISIHYPDCPWLDDLRQKGFIN